MMIQSEPGSSICRRRHDRRIWPLALFIADAGSLTLICHARSWHKVKVKQADPSATPLIGLVPASYLAPTQAIRSTVALYDYLPAVDEQTGQLENDEEMPVVEGEQLEVLDEDEPDWVLCRKGDGQKGVGYVPATYIEVSPSSRAMANTRQRG